MNEPRRKSFSQEEAIATAKAWYRESYGLAKDADDKDAYYTRLGMLLEFVIDTFP